MCGIIGVYNSSGVDLKMIRRMSNLLRHRGPDDEGYFLVDFNNKAHFLRGDDTFQDLSGLLHVDGFNENARLALVHRRLSIIDLTSSGHQPMASKDDKLVIVFNGEIYNYLELRNELIREGYSFKTESDTEVLLASYQFWSEDCVNHFIGMWSFVIYDLYRNILFCSRDRFGIKPFYYVRCDNTFAFGSEIKVLLAIPEVPAILELSNAIEFLVNSNQNFQNKTLFRNIEQLQPGHNLIYDLRNNKLNTFSYYSLRIHDELLSIKMNAAIEEFGRLINESVKIHLRSDVPVGSCLSGGLDSGTIVSTISNNHTKFKLNTFTACFPGQSFDESSFIKLIKGFYEFSDHYTYPDHKTLWNEAALFLWHQELPVQSTSPFAQWEVMKLAHINNIKVLLDGQGMDILSL